MKNYNIILTEEFGRGVYSNVVFNQGDVIFDAEILVLNEQDTKTVNTTSLQYYTFKYNETQDCLVLGDGEIFNHDNHPNVKFYLIEIDGRLKMRFEALSIVLKNTQLFIDYNSDCDIKVEDYISNKSLIEKKA